MVMPLLMFVFCMLILVSGYPVAFALGGSALFFAGLGYLTQTFDPIFLQALPERLFGMMVNETLIAIPLFVFMGLVLQRSKMSEELLETLAYFLRKFPGGLGVSVCLVGGLLAASTGIVGATVVTMGLLSLPTMLKNKYSPSLASGVICASGTLGQIIPPSIVLIILGDVLSSANQQAQLSMGIYSPTVLSVGDLFKGAIVPGVLLMGLYILYVMSLGFLGNRGVPQLAQVSFPKSEQTSTLILLVQIFLPPILLIVAVLGAILAGVATPTEAASVGCIGALLMSYFKGQLDLRNLGEVMEETLLISTMIFTILIGASLFSLIFRGFEGDLVIQQGLASLSQSVGVTFFVVMLVMFVLGFFLDFFEITFVMVPLVAPPLITLGLDPLWLGVMMALNLQTSFLTPPFGFSLFYLRGVAPASVTTTDIYRGVIPFILIQIGVLCLLWFFPSLVTFWQTS